jgi:hypothetical protein
MIYMIYDIICQQKFSYQTEHVGTNKVQIKKGTKGDRVKPATISRLPKFSYSV